MQYLQCIKNQYIQHWHARCIRNNKLEHYVNYKSVFQTEKYITYINIDKFRWGLAKFQCFCLCSMIEAGFYYNIDDIEWTCFDCDASVEEERQVIVCGLPGP